MIFNRNTVVRIAGHAKEYTGGVVVMSDPVDPGDGLRYVDGKKHTLVWNTRVSRTAAREAAAYYAGAVRQWATLHRFDPAVMPRLLWEAQNELGRDTQPPKVREAFAMGVAEAGLAWSATQPQRAEVSLRSQADPGTARVGERRRLTLFNRGDLVVWSGGREPEDLGSDVMLIDGVDGTLLVVVLEQMVERTAGGYRIVSDADVMRELMEFVESTDGGPLAYEYQAGLHHPACTVQAVVDGTEELDDSWLGLLPGDTQTALDELAAVLDVDRGDETSYDTDRFPKEVTDVMDLLPDDVRDPHNCRTCSHPLQLAPLTGTTRPEGRTEDVHV